MRKLLLAVLCFVSGCSAIAYVRIGPQELENVELSLERQHADPNMPITTIDIIRRLLK